MLVRWSLSGFVFAVSVAHGGAVFGDEPLKQLRSALQCQPVTFQAKIADGHVETVQDRVYWQGDGQRFAVSILRMTLLPDGGLPEEIDEVGMAADFSTIDRVTAEVENGLLLVCRAERECFTFSWEAGSGDVRTTSSKDRALIHFCDTRTARSAYTALDALIKNAR